jgi:hypothetical protein
MESDAVDEATSWEGEAPAEPQAMTGLAGASPSQSLGNPGLTSPKRLGVTHAFTWAVYDFSVPADASGLLI